MASWCWSSCFFTACLCCWLVSCCKSDEAPFHGQKRSTPDMVARALICLNDRYIYSGCHGSFRLGPQGALNVPPPETDSFCGGPCLAETNLVLRCIDDIMDNFRFYNGASVGAVRFALDRGCGHTALRGDFDALQRLGGDGYYGDGYVYSHGSGNRRFASYNPTLLLYFSVVAMLLWG